MIPIIAPKRGRLEAIKPFKSGRMFPNRSVGVLDLDNFATRIIKPLARIIHETGNHRQFARRKVEWSVIVRMSDM